MAATGESNAVRLDFRGLGESGPRTVAATEYINHDPGWGDATSGILTINGVAVSGLSGSGTYTWTPDTSQTNFWELGYTAGTVDYSATFQDLSTSIRKISARQRYPWNGLVDLSFMVTGVPGTQYDVSFVATDVMGGTNLAMKTLLDANGSALSLTNSIVPGSYKWVWNAEADLGDGTELEQVAVVGNVETRQWPLYMVIDISGGASAASYPVSYLNDVPEGGWTTTYKTSKIVLRKCDSGSFMMGGSYEVVLTKAFYIGVFEMTQKQYQNVTGKNPVLSNEGYLYGDSKPVTKLDYKTIRGNNNYPGSKIVGSTSFMGLLSSKTKLNFDLPTEAQWEYACRAGTTTSYNNGGSTESDLKTVGRYYGNGSQGDVPGMTSGWHPVEGGQYAPNNWGIYDMHGNIWEEVLDWAGALSSATDPTGPSSGTDRIKRGGDYGSQARECTSSYRYGVGMTWTSCYGFRLCLTIE